MFNNQPNLTKSKIPSQTIQNRDEMIGERMIQSKGLEHKSIKSKKLISERIPLILNQSYNVKFNHEFKKIGIDVFGELTLNQKSKKKGLRWFSTQLELEKTLKDTAFKAASKVAEIDLSYFFEKKEVYKNDWLEFDVSFEFLEAEMEKKIISNDPTNIDISLFKISPKIKPSQIPTLVLFRYDTPSVIVENFNIEIWGGFEYKISPEDLVRLKRYLFHIQTAHKHANALERKVKALEKIHTKAKELEKQKDDLSKFLKGKKSKSKRKKIIEELNRKWGEGFVSQNIKKTKKKFESLQNTLNRKNESIKSLEKQIKKHNEILKKAFRKSISTVENIKGKAAKLFAKSGKKIGGKLIKKIAGKLIPFLNILSTVSDVYDTYVFIREVYEGKRAFGGTFEEEGNKSSANLEDQLPPTNSSNNIPQDSSVDNLVETPIDEKIVDPYEEKVPNLHSNTKLFIEKFKGEIIKLTPERLNELNEAIPKDFSKNQMRELLGLLKERNDKSGSFETLLGLIIQKIPLVRYGKNEVNKNRLLEKVSTSRLIKRNLYWRRKLEWKEEDFGYDGQVDEQFIKTVQKIQLSLNLLTDGIMGPRTVFIFFETQRKFQHPSYLKAKEHLEKKQKEALEKKYKSKNKKGDTNEFSNSQDNIIGEFISIINNFNGWNNLDLGNYYVLPYEKFENGKGNLFWKVKVYDKSAGIKREMITLTYIEFSIAKKNKKELILKILEASETIGILSRDYKKDAIRSEYIYKKRNFNSGDVILLEDYWE